MTSKLERQKEALKEKLAKMVDEYYEKFSAESDNPEFKIDQIEQMMLENRNKMRVLMSEAESGLAGVFAPNEKKSVPSAVEISDEPKKTKHCE